MHFTLLMSGAMAVLACSSSVSARPPVEKIEYRQTPQRTLIMEVQRPPRIADDERRPAVIFFHGGGWNGGNIGQFRPFAEALRERGMVVLLPEYRLKNRDDTTPFESIEDAFAAMRFVRANAQALNVDPERVAAGGGSAGGHLAAALATLTAAFTRDENDPNVDFDARPAALVLCNPVYDNSHDGFGDRWEDASPLHNLNADMPPTVVFLGTEDDLIPVATAEAWQAKQQALGVRSDLHLFEGEGHGFFNRGEGDGSPRQQVEERMIEFFASLGWIDAAE